MRPTVRVASTAVPPGSRRKVVQGMRTMAKDVASVASFWLAGISD